MCRLVDPMGQQQTGFLEELPARGDVERSRFGFGERLAELGKRAIDREAAFGGGERGIGVGRLDEPARKDARAGEVARALVASHHEHLGAYRRIAKHDDGGGTGRLGGHQAIVRPSAGSCKACRDRGLLA